MSSKIQLVQDTTQFKKEILNGFKELFKEAYQQTPQKDTDKLLSRRATADFFGVDSSTLHNWAKSGKLTPYGIGARVYYKMSDIEKALIPLNTKKG